MAGPAGRPCRSRREGREDECGRWVSDGAANVSSRHTDPTGDAGSPDWIGGSVLCRQAAAVLTATAPLLEPAPKLVDHLGFAQWYNRLKIFHCKDHKIQGV